MEKLYVLVELDGKEDLVGGIAKIYDDEVYEDVLSLLNGVNKFVKFEIKEIRAGDIFYSTVHEAWVRRKTDGTTKHLVATSREVEIEKDISDNPEYGVIGVM